VDDVNDDGRSVGGGGGSKRDYNLYLCGLEEQNESD